jgi:hypothetical protein
MNEQQQRREKQQTAINRKANSSVFATYTMAVILEGFALDEEQTTIHKEAVLLREFLGHSDLATEVGDNSDLIVELILRIAPKYVLIPILCELIWRESRKFVELYRQFEPRFEYAREKTVRNLHTFATFIEIDKVKYKEVSKLLNDIKKA